MKGELRKFDLPYNRMLTECTSRLISRLLMCLCLYEHNMSKTKEYIFSCYCSGCLSLSSVYSKINVVSHAGREVLNYWTKSLFSFAALLSKSPKTFAF